MSQKHLTILCFCDIVSEDRQTDKEKDMEIKFVSKTRSRNIVIPVSDEHMRENGHGKVIAEDSGNLNIYQHTLVEGYVLAAPLGEGNVYMSEIRAGDFVSYITITSPETGIHKTYAWLREDFKVYVMNNDGKTVDTLG